MDLNIFLRLPDYCTVLQLEVMTIYWATDPYQLLLSPASQSDSRSDCHKISAEHSLGNVAAVSTFFLGASGLL